MSQYDTNQFLQFYQHYRHRHQLEFYSNREEEFLHAQNEAIWLSFGLIFFAALAGILASVFTGGLQLICLLLAATCPVLSSTLAGYNALYAFEQQAKIYRDARQNLEKLAVALPTVQPGHNDAEFLKQVERYVLETEIVLRTERGYWGQLARNMKPLDI
jgi:hypothetical protein